MPESDVFDGTSAVWLATWSHLRMEIICHALKDWHLTSGLTGYKASQKHPHKWRNSVHPPEPASDPPVIPEALGFPGTPEGSASAAKVSLASHYPRLPGILPAQPLCQETEFLISSQLTPLRRPWSQRVAGHEEIERTVIKLPNIMVVCYYSGTSVSQSLVQHSLWDTPVDANALSVPVLMWLSVSQGYRDWDIV